MTEYAGAVRSTKNPRFSVVIPLFNKAGHIRDTLQSVMRQSVADWEAVVVDDGSTDRSADIVASLTDSRVRLIRQNNAGVAAARNRGVAEACGEYIAFLDADDSWLSGHLAELDRLITAFPDIGLYSVGHEIFQTGELYRPDTGVGDEFFGPVVDFLGAFSRGMALINSSTGCVRRDVFIASGGFPAGVTRGEDVYLWIALGLERGIAHSARVCVVINRDAENRSNDSGNPEVQYYLVYLDELLRASRLDGDQRAGAVRMLRRGLVFAAAGFALDGNRAALAAIGRIPSARSDWIVRSALAIIAIIPTRVLSALRRYRHRRVAHG